MARIRQFKPAFFTDDKVGRLSRDARLFFFGVLSEADDEGRLVDAPKRLAGVIFPFDEDVTPKKVERWISDLEAQQMVVRYQHEGGRFLYVRKFKDHQKMSHPTPSVLPPPPIGPGGSSGGPPEKRRKSTGEPPEDFVPVFEGVFEGVFVSEEVSVFEDVVDPSPNHLVGLAPIGKSEMDRPQDQPQPPRPPAPPDPLLERLLSVWPSRNGVVPVLAKQVLTEARRWLDDRLLDEVVGHMLGMDPPPATPRYLLTVALNWAEQRGAGLSAEAIASMRDAAKSPSQRAAS